MNGMADDPQDQFLQILGRIFRQENHVRSF